VLPGQLAKGFEPTELGALASAALGLFMFVGEDVVFTVLVLLVITHVTLNLTGV
jgi:hypothetical protein